MADDKKQDGLFHWNFDLQETDSDFTDIDYSADAIQVSGNEDREIKPMIFVDGSYKSVRDAAVGEVETELDDEDPKGKKTGPRKGLALGKKKTARDYDGDPDYYEDQKRFSGEKKNIPWKPIIITAAVLLLALIGLVLILAGRDTREKKWALNEDKAIDTLVANYFKAKTDANANAMEKILVPEETVNSLQMTLEAKAYESYNDVRIYAYPGLSKTETGLFLTYNCKFRNIDTQLPTIAWFYVKQDSEENLRLLPLKDTDSNEYKYILSTYSGSIVEKNAQEVKAAYNQAVDGDPRLKKYLAQLAANNYETYIPETTVTDPPTTTTKPTTTVVTEPMPTDNPISFNGFITDDGVRMRSTPSTDSTDNILASFTKGHQLQIIGERNGWYHVIDSLKENGRGGEQNSTGLEGYVYAEYISQTPVE